MLGQHNYEEPGKLCDMYCQQNGGTDSHKTYRRFYNRWRFGRDFRAETSSNPTSLKIFFTTRFQGAEKCRKLS